MAAKRKPYQTYPEAFKLEALRLVEESERPVSEVARQLGLRRNQLYKWKEQMSQHGKVATARRGRPRKAEQSELATLRQENRRLQEENEILKKAAAYFARESK
jgi:transposase